MIKTLFHTTVTEAEAEAEIYVNEMNSFVYLAYKHMLQVITEGRRGLKGGLTG